MSPSQVADLPVAVLRSAFPAWAAAYAAAPPEIVAEIEARLRAMLDTMTDELLAAFLAAFRTHGEEWRFYPAHPFGRALTRTYMPSIVVQPTVEGRDRLERFVAEGPSRRIIICNHLSYADTQVTDAVLATAGLAGVADRLVAVAGPKVYTDTWRRLAAISLNTRKTVQSSQVATEQGALGPRELARIARETLDDCERLMDEGWIILLYPEGTRARGGRLGPFLRAVTRYTMLADLQILVMAQTGSERVFPIDDGRMHPSAVRLAFGEPLVAAEHVGKGAALAESWARLAALLPEAYRPDDSTPPLV